jgi:hypothetical protein
LINALITSPDAEGHRILPVLADAVDNHIRFEERDLFPHLEKQLSEAQLESAGNRINEKPHLSDDWPDEFWKDNKRSDTLKK